MPYNHFGITRACASHTRTHINRSKIVFFRHKNNSYLVKRKECRKNGRYHTWVARFKADFMACNKKASQKKSERLLVGAEGVIFSFLCKIMIFVIYCNYLPELFRSLGNEFNDQKDNEGHTDLEYLPDHFEKELEKSPPQKNIC